MGPKTIAVGFDVGSFNCCVATVQGRVVDAVGDEYDKRQIPAFVLFDDYMQYIGRDAKANQDINYENTIFDFKQFLGKSSSELRSMNLNYPYKFVDGTSTITVNFGDKTCKLLPEQLLAMLLSKLKTVAEANTGQALQSFVLNVPVFFNEAQRRALYDSFSIAGLNCLELLEDTTAIALNYAHTNRHLPDKPDQYVTVAFVTVGYSCTEVAICKMNKQQIFICAQSWDANLGGKDFDMAIYKYLEESHPFLTDADAITRVKVLQACEEAKKRMGLHKKFVEILVESLPVGQIVQAKIDRATFERKCGHLLKRFEDTLTRCKSKSVFPVEVVELVGGGVRVPAVKECIHKVFGIAGQITMNGDEAVASGCALRAAALQSPTDTTVCKIMVMVDTQEKPDLDIDNRALQAYQNECRGWNTEANRQLYEPQQQYQPHQQQQYQGQQQYPNTTCNVPNQFVGSNRQEYEHQQQQYPVHQQHRNINPSAPPSDQNSMGQDWRSNYQEGNSNPPQQYYSQRRL